MATFIKITILYLVFNNVLSFDLDDLEIFDLVEEINQNFYVMIGVDQSATTAEIRRSYRRLSLQLHPDKNKEPDAELKFRQVNLVYEVLKDESKRKKYDQVLVTGLPDWRQPVFYYRRIRKIGLWELAGFLLVAVTVGQYLVLWSIYIERKYTLEENFSSKSRRIERKAKKKQAVQAEELEEAFQEELDLIPKPKISDLIPCKLVVLSVHAAISLPLYCTLLRAYIVERVNKPAIEEEIVEEDSLQDIARRPKKRVKAEGVEYAEEWSQADILTSAGRALDDDLQDTDTASPANKNTEWTNEELGLLSKAVSKFPGGTPKRWDKISEMVGRSIEEVIMKSKDIRGKFNMAVDPSMQGTIGDFSKPVSFKKGHAISDEIISQNEDLPDIVKDHCPDLNMDPSQVRRRTKVKSVKSPERTLVMSQNATEERVLNTVDSLEAVTSSDKTIMDKTNPPTNRDVVKSKSDMTATKNKMKSTSSNQNLTSSSLTSVSASSSPHNPSVVSEESSTLNDGEQVGAQSWTQNQQMIFEWAIKQYPKGTDQRWEKISEHISGKTKEDCVVRFKQLVELVKKRKGTSS